MINPITILYIKTKKKVNFKAFTLAEVLITLTIIGVSTAIILPTLLNNVQNEIFKPAVKKSYATFSQVALNIKNENGGTLENVFRYSDSTKTTNVLSAHLSTAKKCSGTQFEGVCWHARDKWYNYDGSKDTMGSPDSVYAWNSAFIMNDGTLIMTSTTDNSACDGQSGVWYVWGHVGINISNVCSAILVDINGFKGPNTKGKDIHEFFFLKNGTVVPHPANNEGSGIYGDCGFKHTKEMLAS